MFNYRIVKRKWGWYWTILDRKHFKVKLLKFVPGGSISNQYHKLRGELWLFLTGNGVMESDKTCPKAGDYKLITPGELHKYIAVKPTYILEIQYGEKCIEEDIVRV